MDEALLILNDVFRCWAERAMGVDDAKEGVRVE